MKIVPGSTHARLILVRLAVFATLVILLSACGVESDSLTTVDNAVTLLQDLENTGVWITLSDGLNVLDDYDGYLAQFTLQTGPLDTAGNTVTLASAQTRTITIQVDSEGTAQYTITDGDQARQVLAISTGTAAPLLLEQNGAHYTCADAATAAQLAEGPLGLFEDAGFKRAGLAALAVVDDDGDSTLIDREATHYQIATRLDDALAILGDTGNATLREQIQQAGGYTLVGTLDLDNTTGGLLYFAGTYTDTAAHTDSTLTFEVIQWGDVPVIELPADDQLPACTQ